MNATTAFRGSILHFLSDQRHEFLEDGVLVVEKGYVERMGKASELLPTLGPMPVKHVPDSLIVPGFVDTHTHYAQTGIMASFGEQVLDWLQKYTFPEEKAFSDEKIAREAAKFFLSQCLANGTTTALVFATVHPIAVSVLFEEAAAFDMRVIAGKVLMDRNAPDYLLENAQTGYVETKRLIDLFHRRGRLGYAITPRFAPTSSPEQLSLVGKLLQEYPDVYLQTHLAENQAEIEWVKKLFPEAKSYLDVYAQYGFLRKRSLFAHCVHLQEDEFRRIASADAACIFCPTSNLFLGSGLFDLSLARRCGAKVAMGTDVGAGTSFSMLQTLNEAYKVGQLRGTPLKPLDAFYQITLAGAKALDIDDKIGNFERGKEADFAILSLKATPILSYRMDRAKTLEEKLFSLMTLGGDRAVHSTYLRGRLVYQNP